MVGGASSRVPEERRVPLGTSTFNMSRVRFKRQQPEYPMEREVAGGYVRKLMTGAGSFRGKLFDVLDVPYPIVDSQSNDTRAVAVFLTKDKDGDVFYGFGLDPVSGTPVEVEITDKDLVALGEWITVKKDLTYLKPLTPNEVIEIQNRQASLLAQRRSEENRRQMTLQGFTSVPSYELMSFMRDVLPKVTVMAEYFSKPGNERALALLLQSQKISQILRTSKHFKDITILPQLENPQNFHDVLQHLARAINNCPNKLELGNILKQNPEFIQALADIDYHQMIADYVKGYKDSRQETLSAEDHLRALLSTDEGRRLLEGQRDAMATYEERGEPLKKGSLRDTPKFPSKYPTSRKGIEGAGNPPPEAIHERMDKDMGVGKTPSPGPDVSTEPMEIGPGEMRAPMSEAIEEDMGLPPEPMRAGGRGRPPISWEEVEEEDEEDYGDEEEPEDRYTYDEEPDEVETEEADMLSAPPSIPIQRKKDERNEGGD